MTTEEKLQELRKQWLTASRTDRKLIEMRANTLKMGMNVRGKEIPDTPESLKAIFPPFRYEVKSIPTGFMLGLKNASRYALIPAKYWDQNIVIEVKYQEEVKRFKESDVVKRIILPDKIKPGTDYKVTYVVWSK